MRSTMRATFSEVVTPAPDQNLVSLGTVKLEFDLRDDDQDVYLQQQIARASDEIVQYCNRVFAQQVYKDTFLWSYRDHYGFYGVGYGYPYHGGRRMLLRNRPVVPGSVTVQRDGIDLIEGQDYSVVATNGEVHLWAYTIPGGKLEVTYSAGFALPGSAPDPNVPRLPSSIERCALMMILAYRQAGRVAWTDRDPFLRSETIEGAGSLTYSTEPMGGGGGGGQITVGGMSLAVREALDGFVFKGPQS